MSSSFARKAGFFCYLALVLWLTMDTGPGLAIQAFVADHGLSLGAPAESVAVNVALFQPGVLPLNLFLYNLAVNVLLFIPLGFLLASAYGADRFWIKMAACALFSFGIETIQFMLAHRAADINDLITNSVGALLGLAWRKYFGFRLFPYSPSSR